MRISDWSSDVCSSDLRLEEFGRLELPDPDRKPAPRAVHLGADERHRHKQRHAHRTTDQREALGGLHRQHRDEEHDWQRDRDPGELAPEIIERRDMMVVRSEEHTSELQSLMRSSYAVFCLKK